MAKNSKFDYTQVLVPVTSSTLCTVPYRVNRVLPGIQNYTHTSYTVLYCIYGTAFPTVLQYESTQNRIPARSHIACQQRCTEDAHPYRHRVALLGTTVHPAASFYNCYSANMP